MAADPKTVTVQERLRARRESFYDFATQGAEWQEDALCIEAADLLDICQAALERISNAPSLEDADGIAREVLTQLNGGRK